MRVIKGRGAKLDSTAARRRILEELIRRRSFVWPARLRRDSRIPISRISGSWPSESSESRDQAIIRALEKWESAKAPDYSPLLLSRADLNHARWGFELVEVVKDRPNDEYERQYNE